MDKSVNILLVRTRLFPGETGVPLLTSCFLATALLTGGRITAPCLLEAAKMHCARLEDACSYSFWTGNLCSCCHDILCKY